MRILLLFVVLAIWIPPVTDWYLPIKAKARKDASLIKLTAIGKFGEERVARPQVPAHLHTGIDIKRPSGNYGNEPVFTAAGGTVISMRDDGPFAQIIIEHKEGPNTVWTVYEHIAGIRVAVGDRVEPNRPIARFMNKEELKQYGWHFDHLHFEVMRAEPIQLHKDPNLPQRVFNTHTLTCYTPADLHQKYFNPLGFLKKRFQ